MNLAVIEDRPAVEILDDVLKQSAESVPADGPSLPTKADTAPK